MNLPSRSETLTGIVTRVVLTRTTSPAPTSSTVSFRADESRVVVDVAMGRDRSEGAVAGEDCPTRRARVWENANGNRHKTVTSESAKHCSILMVEKPSKNLDKLLWRCRIGILHPFGEKAMLFECPEDAKIKK